jgi:hypothetical protein
MRIIDVHLLHFLSLRRSLFVSTFSYYCWFEKVDFGRVHWVGDSISCLVKDVCACTIHIGLAHNR